MLLRKEYSISGFSEGGEVVEDEIIDSLVYVTNENYFCRVLGQKQYELSNHLGNVLATVLDRRTAVYHPQADTFLYFTADVVNASIYYPFGQALMNYKNEDFVFSYGLNGQEKEDAVFEGVYSAEYWMYDSRLGRRWNVDPIVKVHESPYATFANNPMWFVDPNGADTVNVANIDNAAEGINNLTTELESLGNEIKKIEEHLNEMYKARDEHTAWSIGLGTATGGLGAIVMELHWKLTGKEEIIETTEKQLSMLQEEFSNKYNTLTLFRNDLESFLKNVDAIEMGNGLIYSALAVGAIHKNTNSYSGARALYQIELNGVHYKFGIADATNVLKSDRTISGPKGSQTIKAGTPIRIYEQQRTAIKLGYKIDVQYKVHNQITTYEIKKLESTNIWSDYISKKYVGDGHTQHARRWKAPQQGGLPNKLKK